MHKPSLTKRVAADLEALAGFADSQALGLDDGEQKEQINRAVEWLDKLINHVHTKHAHKVMAIKEGKAIG